MESGIQQEESRARSKRIRCCCNGGGGGNFECNICLELPEDAIITQCGHLYCWPCLYRWLHDHSKSQECPVCKALIQQHKLVPVYGRGESETTTGDPRLRPVAILGGGQSGIPLSDHIPNRPAGQRPETAPPPPPTAQDDGGVFRITDYLPVGNLTVYVGMATPSGHSQQVQFVSVVSTSAVSQFQ